MMNDEKKKKSFPWISKNRWFQFQENFEFWRKKNKKIKKFKGCPRKKDFNFKFKNKNDEKKFF